MYTLLHKKIKGKPYSVRHYRGFPKLFLENQALLGFHEAKTGVECGSWASSGILKTGSRLAFVGCEISAGTSAGAGGGSSQAQARREVVVSGKRVKTIDVHAHCIVPEAAQLINHPLEAPGLLWSNVGDRLAQMDHTGVDVEALSINPYWYRAERDAVAEVIQVQNEALVAFCASQ